MRWSVLAFLIQLVSIPVIGQVLEGSFVNYTYENGLSSSNITCLAEDSTGFIWVGTEEGLNRFDGVNFKVFLKDDGEESISGNYITRIHVLPDNRMLVGTYRGGLSLYDPEGERFTEIQTADSVSKNTFRSVTDIMPFGEDKFVISYLWRSPFVGGITVLDLNTLTQSQVFHDIERATKLLLDKDDPTKVWATGEKIYLLDFETNSYESMTDTLTGSRNMTYYQDLMWRGDKIWIGTWNHGICELDPTTKRVEHSYEYDPILPSRNRNVIRRIIEAEDGNYWVSSADKGFGKFYPADSSFAFYQNDKTNPNSIFHISSRDVMIDSRGLIWVAMAEGLSLKSPYMYQIQSKELGWMENVQNRRLFEYQQVTSVGDYWLVASGRGGGFYKLDAETKEIINAIGYDPERKIPLSSNAVRTTDNGKVFTQHWRTIHEIDIENETNWQIIDLFEWDEYCCERASINTIMDHGNDLWFGTDDNVVGKYDSETEELELWDLEPSIEENLINLVYEVGISDEGDLWVGATKGVYRLREGEVTHLRELSPEYDKLGTINMESLVVSGDYVVFGAQEKGLFTYNTVSGELIRYSRKDGLPNMRVAEMEVDLNGRIWGLTAGGMFCLDPEQNDPLQVYDYEDGLTARDLIRKEISALRSGEITIGAGLSICYFHPDDLKPQPIPEKLIVADCQINGEPVAGTELPKIQVNYDDRLDIKFQALGYIKPEKYQYYFRQDPEDEWSSLSDPTLSFYSFPGGGVTLEVIASNERGERMASPMVIEIDVKLPFYRTSWFAILVFLVIVSLSYVIYTARLRRVKKEERVRAQYQQKLVEVEMSALRAQMNPHFLFNCLNSIKFFIINKETDQASDYLTKFSRLIRLILTNSKSELIPLSGELEALDLYVDLESLRFDQQFEFDLQVAQGVQTEFIEVPPMIIQPFVENAIWHGLLHKKSAGRLLVDISIEGDHLVCIIEDDGIGRVKAAEMRSKTVSREKSMGMDITRNRLLRMEGGSEAERQLSIEDLYHEDGSPAGTRIKMLIPIN